MNEFLKNRIERKLEALSDEHVYQVLDYIEFLETRYGQAGAEAPTAFQRLAEKVEDTLRAGRVSASVVKGTMDAMSAAGRVMEGLAAAGKAVVEQVAGGGGAAKPAGTGESKGPPREGPGPGAGAPPEDRPGSA
jgi:hypothetical protein